MNYHRFNGNLDRGSDMNSSRYARGLAALSVAVLATGLLFSPLATSQLLAEDAASVSGDTRQLAESNTAENEVGSMGTPITIAGRRGRLTIR